MTVDSAVDLSLDRQALAHLSGPSRRSARPRSRRPFGRQEALRTDRKHFALARIAELTAVTETLGRGPRLAV